MVHLSQGTVSAEIQRDPCKVRSNLFNFSVLAKEIRFEAFATCVEIRHASLKVSFAFFSNFSACKEFGFETFAAGGFQEGSARVLLRNSTRDPAKFQKQSFCIFVDARIAFRHCVLNGWICYPEDLVWGKSVSRRSAFPIDCGFQPQAVSSSSLVPSRGFPAGGLRLLVVQDGGI